jgi:Zn-dependent protease
MGLWLGWFVFPDTAYFDALVAMPGGVSAGLLGTVLSVFLTLNVFLGVFNLLPLPPLDGSAVFSVLIPPRFASRARELQNNGFASILGLFVAWQIFPLITGPLFSLMLELLHPGEF